MSQEEIEPAITAGRGQQTHALRVDNTATGIGLKLKFRVKSQGLLWFVCCNSSLRFIHRAQDSY